MNMEKMDHVLSVNCKLGEGPLWHPDEGMLYWVDIDRGRLHRLAPRTQNHDVFEVGLPVGCMAFRAGGGLVLATRDGFAYWRPVEQELEFIADPETDVPDGRFNDGAVDRRGRFWAGTLNDRRAPTSSLYRLDSDLTVHTMDSGFKTPNGIGWSLDGKTMYFTDTRRRTIFAYDFDMESASINNRRPFIQVPDEEGQGRPDGLTVDAEGCIWSARWGGWKVVRYTPDGHIDREIRLPVECPTSCTFGGENMDDLYITSAWTALDADGRRRQPLAGDVFRFRAGIKGLPEPFFAG